MATATLIPTANQSFSSGTITYTGGSANYTNLSDASDSTYVNFSGSNAFASYPLTDTASNMGTVTAVTITVRTSRGTKGDYAQLESVQILKSDGSTAITSTGTATDSSTITTFNITPSTINYTDKTSWDGAVLKIKQNVGTGSGITIYEASVAITYTPSSTNYTETMSGGYSLGGDTPVTANFKESMSNGYALGGDTTNVANFKESMSNGYSLGGDTPVAANYTESMNNGYTLGGDTNYGLNFFESMNNGYALGGDTTIAANYTESMNNGYALGGDTPVSANFNETMIGGYAFGGITSISAPGLAYSTYLNKIKTESHLIPYCKTLQTQNAPFCSSWISSPKPGATPSTPTTCDNTTTGAMNKETLIGSIDSDWRLNAVTSNQTLPIQYTILDRLSHSGGLATNTTSTQTTNLPTAPLTRYTNGNNVFIFLEFYASAAGSTVTTATVSYTNQDGTPGRTSKPVVFGNFNPSKAVFVPLQDEDTGVRSVESVTLDADIGLNANFGVTLFRVVAMTHPFRNQEGFYGSNSYNAIIGGACHFEPILPGACLQIIHNGTGGSVHGIFNFVEVSL